MAPLPQIATSRSRWMLLLLAACLSLGWLRPATAQDAASYTLVVPKDVPLSEVQMFHALKRTVGRYSWPEYSKLKNPQEHAIVFPLKAGDSFEAVFYYPGYQFVTVYDPAVAAGDHRAELAFQPLATVVLKGKCPMRTDKDMAAVKYVVQITYSGGVGITHLEKQWGHSLAFPIMEVPIAADGTFTAKVPDFARDPLSAKDGFGRLDFSVHSTSEAKVTWTKKEIAERRSLGLPDSSMIQSIGFVSYGLAPKDSDDIKNDESGDPSLKIKPAYPKRVEFVEHSGPPIDGPFKSPSPAGVK